MQVDIVVNRNDASKHLAIIDIPISKWGPLRLPAYFGQEAEPDVGPAEVMIVGVLHPPHEKGPNQGKPNLDASPRALFIKSVDPTDKTITKVKFLGFKRSIVVGGIAVSWAKSLETGAKFLITPGRMSGHLFTNRQEIPNEELVGGGIGYASEKPNSPYMRLEGVDDFSLIRWFEKVAPDF